MRYLARLIFWAVSVHPTPILFNFNVRRKWSHNVNKKSYNIFLSPASPLPLHCPPHIELLHPTLAIVWHSCLPEEEMVSRGCNCRQVSPRSHKFLWAPGLQTTQGIAMALSLEEFVHSLDLRTLPRVLEIQAGIYFEGKHSPIPLLTRTFL